MQRVILAIPKFGQVVAPCFEVASEFLFVVIESGRKTGVSYERCGECEGIGRVRFVQDHHGDILICNGIKAFYKDLLVDSGIGVISGVALEIEPAIAGFINGDLKPDTESADFIETSEPMPLADMVCWARDLFKTSGYEVHKGENRAPFPIDLIAEMKCPVCHRPIRVAICCGAHTYRVDQELREFRRVSANDYHARIYVYPDIGQPGAPDLKKRCEEFGIELLDPLTESVEETAKRKIPIIKGSILDHEEI